MKEKITHLIKILIGLSLVIWILSQVDRSKFYDYFLEMDLTAIIMILPLSLLSLLIQFWRWRYLVSSYSSDYHDRDLIPSFFAGFAFRLMIPGGHAELSKVFLLPGKKRGKVVAFGMERIFQSIVKIVLAAGLLVVHFPQYQTISILIILITIVIYFILPHVKYLTGLYEKQVRYHSVFIRSLWYSAGVYAIMLLQYYILMRQAYPITFDATAYTVVYLWGAGLVPISISGLGVREGLAVYFFSLYGVPAAFSVATSLFLFVFNAILPALAGVYFIYQKREYLREIRTSFKSTRNLLNGLRNSSPKRNETNR